MVRDCRDVGSVIADLARDRRLHLVGAGDAALLTLSLAKQYSADVGSVVLVDPPWPEDDQGPVRRVLDGRVSEVFQVATGSDEALPIGHPDVVQGVLQALLLADLWPIAPASDG
jgi:pimeloyl-ACP methyl ester carboxylesterase